MSATGLEAVVDRYAEHGPLLASFLANLLATFGDKGQLVVVALASRYDAKRVFAGAMGAFALWSALEVAFGSYVTAMLPAGVMTAVTGGLFLAFGAWTLLQVIDRVRATELPGPGGVSAATAVDRVVPVDIAARGAVVTSFVFIMFAEFGDKTQFLTIALAGAFPDAPLSVFAGVVGALALRTGIDAVIGEQVERALPTTYIEAAAAAIFVAFGLTIFGVLSETTLVGVVVVSVGGAAVAGVRRWRRPDSDAA